MVCSFSLQATEARLAAVEFYSCTKSSIRNIKNGSHFCEPFLFYNNKPETYFLFIHHPSHRPTNPHETMASMKYAAISCLGYQI